MSDKYQLEYDWGRVKITGTVKVENHGAPESTTQHQDLWVGNVHVARYVRHRRNDVWEQGETKLAHGTKSIGKGNLLAGALLVYCLKEQNAERPFQLKEFFPELFPSPQGREVL